MAWTIAPSLETLRHQLNEAFPNRSKVSDGGIGDEGHSARSSDHNPNTARVVCARDFTHDPDGGIDCHWLAKTLVANQDSRIKYLIWDKKICSSKTSPWKWRPYSGVNAHRHHLHISVGPDAKEYNNSRQWELDFPDDFNDDDIARVSTPASPDDGKAVPIAVNDKLLNPPVKPQEPGLTESQIPIVPVEQTLPAITNTTTEAIVREKTDGVETTTTTTAETVAAPIEVQKEKASVKTMLIAFGTMMLGAWKFAKENFNELVDRSVQAIDGHFIANLLLGAGLVALGIWLYDRSQKRANDRTEILMDMASDHDKTTVILTSAKWWEFWR